MYLQVPHIRKCAQMISNDNTEMPLTHSILHNDNTVSTADNAAALVFQLFKWSVTLQLTTHEWDEYTQYHITYIITFI